MKSAFIAIALLVAGCTEQAVVESPGIQKRWFDMIRDSVASQQWDIDSNTIWVVPIEKYVDAINFAAWCQKAHPDVWREYHATHTGGE